MPQAPIRWTADLVRTLPDDGNRYELVGGALLVTPAPSPRHQLAVRALVRRLDPYVQRLRLGELLFSPADISLGEDEILQPDLFVAPASARAPIRHWSEIHHLLLAIEVLSPSTARYDRHSREPLLVTATGLVLAAVLVGTLHYSARFEGWGAGSTGSFRPSIELIAEEVPRFGTEPLIKDKHVAGLGKTLFVDHAASVEVIGVVLLAAVVGAVLIAGHKVEGPRSRDKPG